MATISKDGKTNTERAIEQKPPTDGAHSARARKAIKKEQAENDPAFVVTVKAKEVEKDKDGNELKEKSFYSPEEIRSKARGLLHSGKLTSQEKEVLNEILGPKELAKAPKIQS